MEVMEKELIDRCIAGDQDAQATFIGTYSNLVFRTVQYTLKSKNVAYSHQEVEDLHNSIFVKMFERRCKKIAQFEGKNGCSLTSWIRLIAGSSVLDYIRKKRNEPTNEQQKAIPLDAVYGMADHRPDPQTLLENEERNQTVRAAMERLATRERLFLTLHFVDGLPINEVASILGVTANNAYQIKHQAIKHLKEKLFKNEKKKIHRKETAVGDV